jgi:hypothetical protein
MRSGRGAAIFASFMVDIGMRPSTEEPYNKRDNRREQV